MSTPARLVDDLASVGVDGSDIWELVNAEAQYLAAIPVLI